MDLSKRFGVSRRRVYDWVYWGWLRARRSGGRWHVSEADTAFFESVCRGARGRLMPSLYDWEPLWQARQGRPAGLERTASRE